MFVRYGAVIVGSYLFAENPEAREAFAGLAMVGAALGWAVYARVFKKTQSEGDCQCGCCSSKSSE